MNASLAAVLPVFLLMVLGHWARRSGFLDAVFWVQAERATYYLLFPALLLTRLAQAELDWQASQWLLIAALLLISVAAALCFGLQWLLRLSAHDFTAFFQGGIRLNNFIALGLIATLPDPALTVLALLMAVFIPAMNVLSVLVLSRYARAKPNYRAVLSGVLQNPLVLACASGILLNTCQWLPPPVLLGVLETLGAMAAPLGLLAVGAGLKLQALRAAGWVFVWNTLLKLVLMPLLGLVIALLLPLDRLTLSVFVVYSALPTASAAYILTRQMGGNAELMAGIITGQTLVSMLTLPLVLLLLTYLPG